jgi:hypothetical protein
MSVRALLLTAAVLGLPLAAAAQGITTLRGQGLACVRGGPGTACKPFLDSTNRLKKQAEAAKQLRCYTALLGFEARVMALPPEAAADPAVLDAASDELRAECPALP